MLKNCCINNFETHFQLYIHSLINSLVQIKAIFASALNYVQEREEPVDFLDIFYDLEKQKDNLGIFEDINQFKHQKKVYLSPLKQKNQNSSYQNNSTMNLTAGNDFFNNRSNSVFYSSQNNRASNNNKSQKTSKLSPLKIDNQSPKRFGNNSSLHLSGSQTSKNLKTTLGATNAVKGIGIGLNNQTISLKSGRDQVRPIQNQSKQNHINGEIGDLDDLYKSSLFQNNLSKQRLQQIEFYPSPAQKGKAGFNILNQNQQQINNESQLNELGQQDSLLHYDLNDQNNPYSLKNGNHILKEHFNLQISSVPDPRKKYVLRKVNKPSINMNLTAYKKEGKFPKKQQHSNQNNNEFQQLSTQTDDGNAFDSVQQSQHSVKEQILFQSLKPSFGGSTYGSSLQMGYNFPLSATSSGSNQFINLNNLMVSVNTPTFFFTQQQFFNQNDFPKTAPSGAAEARKERGFQIKKFQNNVSGVQHGNKPSTSQSSQMKIDSRQVYNKDQPAQNNFFTKQKMNKVKSDQNFHVVKLRQSQDPYDDQHQIQMQNGGSTSKKGRESYNSNHNKSQNQFYASTNGINDNMSMLHVPLFENNSKSLPLYCLNFNKTLEKRLLLNSLGV